MMMRIRFWLSEKKDSIPFWGFPAILVGLGLVAAVVVILATRGGDSRVIYVPGQDKTGEISKIEPQSSEHMREGTGSGQSGAGTVAEAPESAHLDLSSIIAPVSSSNSSLSNGGDVPGPDSVIEFKCYGRAHGVGLCMDGVKYRALDGQSYTDIINYYYTGVQFTQVDDGREIKVKGQDGQVHSLPMKEYLYHLAEEPEDYPAEGLKVLYVAARTYTLSVIARGKHASEGYDICASGECCQAFDENKDLSKSPNNVAAVDATSGQALFYDGNPITAAYCGSCGGHTENNEDVWGGQALPYLRGKPDSYCARSDRFCVTEELTVREFQSKLGVGELKSIDLSDRTPGGRIKTARFVGSSTKEMTGKQLAELLGFRTPRIDYSFK